MTSKISGPKGAPDILPPESERQDQIIAGAVEMFRLFGYHRIETPIFEHTELFERGLQAGSDIVTKEMYTFEDKGGRSLTLRPDMTAPVMRSIVEHGLDRAGLPVKLFYVAQVFRHERPQAGRFRQFRQAGVEAVGSAGPEIDAEVIQLASKILARIGVSSELKLNSVGHSECRETYLPKLVDFLQAHAFELCEDCRRKTLINPLRTFDCKRPEDKAVLENAPVLSDHLCVDCKQHYESLKDLLGSASVSFSEDPRLVRGLDYYSRTAFEFVAEGLGSQDAVGAGGRYDGLSEQLGGPSLPGIGFGLGIDRIALSLQKLSGAVQEGDVGPGLQAFVVSVGEPARAAALALAAQLRGHGIPTDLDYSGRSTKGQFKAADRLGARWVVVVGGQELESGLFTLKNMETGEETRLDLENLAQSIASYEAPSRKTRPGARHDAPESGGP